jgi:hypothetical protein
MSRLLALAFLLGFGYWVWTVGIPWFEERRPLGTEIDAPRVFATSARRCVEAAEAASGSFGQGIAEFSRPPVNPAAWGAVFISVTSSLAAAETECGCDASPCHRAREAIESQRELLLEFDTAVRGAGPPPQNAGFKQQQVSRLLEEARDMID